MAKSAPSDGIDNSSRRSSRRRRSSSSNPLTTANADISGQRGRRRRSRHRGESKAPALMPPRYRLAHVGLPQTGVLVIIGALVAALFLGGGGTTNPDSETALQVIVALTIALQLLWPRLQTGLGPVPRSAWAIAALVIVIPVAQLIPLPPSLWHALPGRDVEVAALSLIGAADRWMPWSMAPGRTFISLLATVIPLVLLLVVSRTDLAGRMWICATIVLFALLSIPLGTLQISRAGGHNWTLYAYSHTGVIVGFQANHNAEADVLAIALLAAGVLACGWVDKVRNRTAFWCATGLTAAILAITALLTGSRTGIVLLPVAVIGCLAMLWPVMRQHMSAGRLWLMLLGGAAVAALALLSGLRSIDRILARFSNLKDARSDIWKDTVEAIGTIWPAGSGVGSFPPIFNAHERLEVVTNTFAGRAHNDWLEWTLEGGLPGLVVLAALLGLLIWLLWRRIVAERSDQATLLSRAQAVFACGVLVILGAHGLDDFPFRSMALASLAAVAAAMLLVPYRQATHPLAMPRPDTEPDADTAAATGIVAELA